MTFNSYAAWARVAQSEIPFEVIGVPAQKGDASDILMSLSNRPRSTSIFHQVDVARPIGPLVLFSTETGIAWILDPSDQLAAELARDRNPEAIDFEETDTNFAMDWKGDCCIQGRAFVYANRKAGPRHRDPWLSRF